MRREAAGGNPPVIRGSACRCRGLQRHLSAGRRRRPVVRRNSGQAALAPHPCRCAARHQWLGHGPPRPGLHPAWWASRLHRAANNLGRTMPRRTPDTFSVPTGAAVPRPGAGRVPRALGYSHDRRGGHSVMLPLGSAALSWPPTRGRSSRPPASCRAHRLGVAVAATRRPDQINTAYEPDLSPTSTSGFKRRPAPGCAPPCPPSPSCRTSAL